MDAKMENEKETLSGPELLAVMDLASQKRLAIAMSALKAEGLIFYAVAFVIDFLVCLCLEEACGWLIILYGISAFGAGYVVRNVRKTRSARSLCFLLTVLILFLSLWLSMMIFSHMVSPYRYSETSFRYLYPDLYSATNFPGMVKDFFALLRELGNNLFFAAVFILGSFALKATTNDLSWDSENPVESIRIEDGRTLIKGPQAQSEFSDWRDRLCVVLGWIFLSMNLLLGIYRCMRSYIYCRFSL